MEYTYSGSGTGKGMEMSNGNYNSGSGRGWGAIIIIIIIIIIICCCIWWFWSSNKNKHSDSCDHLAGSKWKGDGHYAGTKQNSNLQADCHQEWLELEITKAEGKCIRVSGEFKIASRNGYKLDTKATGSFKAVGVVKDGHATLTVVDGQGDLILSFHDDHNIGYTLNEFNNVRGTGEKGVSSGHLHKVVDKYEY